jgi:hypothetical protein
MTSDPRSTGLVKMALNQAVGNKLEPLTAIVGPPLGLSEAACPTKCQQLTLLTLQS